jgi:hypothetical protein
MSFIVRFVGCVSRLNCQKVSIGMMKELCHLLFGHGQKRLVLTGVLLDAIATGVVRRGKGPTNVKDKKSTAFAKDWS